ncbi:hypothetical protein [Pseudonocardia charpentierae]|uniref:Uncharacterized protein n=1 Tax=Pseudonocardia charpentierae TaxID=3075545 RepID=A0ABU2N315_9PSEU|nr:hypothetical protein [Pseudonocardia sp. DSM 45834]MDT0348136.1 hypothetical protein [Pseudonocardia sp. DSM 45834]
MAARDQEAPSIREIAELTARLRRLSAAGPDADPVERAEFLADNHALLDRIDAANRDDTVDAAADAGGDERGPGEPVDDDLPHRDRPEHRHHTSTDPATPTATADGPEPPLLPACWPLPPQMLDGMQERRTAPAHADDPAELLACLDELRQRLNPTAPGTSAAPAVDDDAIAAEQVRYPHYDPHTDAASDAERGW